MEVARRHRVGRPLSEHSATSEWSFQQLSAKAQRLIHLWSFCERDARGIRVCGEMDERPSTRSSCPQSSLSPHTLPCCDLSC